MLLIIASVDLEKNQKILGLKRKTSTDELRYSFSLKMSIIICFSSILSAICQNPVQVYSWII